MCGWFFLHFVAGIWGTLYVLCAEKCMLFLGGYSPHVKYLFTQLKNQTFHFGSFCFISFVFCQSRCCCCSHIHASVLFHSCSVYFAAAIEVLSSSNLPLPHIHASQKVSFYTSEQMFV